MDRQERERKAVKAIMIALLRGNIKEAWCILKAWDHEAGSTTTKPYHAYMERQTVEGDNLYDFKASPGEHIPANRDPILLPHEVPPEAEIRAAVKALRNGRTDGGSMMQEENLKSWLRRA